MKINVLMVSLAMVSGGTAMAQENTESVSVAKRSGASLSSADKANSKDLREAESQGLVDSFLKIFGDSTIMGGSKCMVTE